MKIAPDSHVRVANGEAASFELCADAALTKVILRPGASADAQEITLDGGKLKLPKFDACPAIVKAAWFADGSEDAAFQSTFEIVPRHYFAIDRLKSYGDGTDDFSMKSDEELWAARQAATETFELNAKRTFVRRCGCTKVYSPWRYVELDDCDVDCIESPGYARLVSDCQVAVNGRFEGEPCEIKYVYGTGHVPARVSQAVLDLDAYYLRSDVVPSRAVGEATDAGFLRFTIAGRDGATGLPEVDAIIEQFGRKRYGVA